MTFNTLIKSGSKVAPKPVLPRIDSPNLLFHFSVPERAENAHPLKTVRETKQVGKLSQRKETIQI